MCGRGVGHELIESYLFPIVSVEARDKGKKKNPPFEYVIGQNERRRQLTIGQKAVVGERLATLKRGGNHGNQYTKKSGKGSEDPLATSNQSSKQTGKQLGIGHSSIDA
jgi:hypothetical protein